jgi:hypothetical protein
MWIMVAGPVSAPDDAGLARNLERMALEALAVRALGHVPIVAHYLAAPLRAADDTADRQVHYLALCRALAERCDAIYLYAESPGAKLERAEFERRGQPVYRTLSEIPRERE